MKKTLLIISIFSLLSTTAFAGTFSDVDSTHMYSKGIEILAENNIVNGYPDGSYQPDGTINRAEMLKILYEGEAIFSGEPSTFLETYKDESCFGDVPSNEWFTKYVCAAKDLGVVVGYDNGAVFRPAQEVTFVEAAKMTLEVFRIPYIVTDEIWYEGPVNSASFGNYIPLTINSFNKKLTRGEMADMIARILTNREGTQEEYLGDLQYLNVTFDTISEAEMLTTDDIVYPEEVDTSNFAQYIDYTDGILDTLSADSIPLLYFHADWCPTCLALQAELLDPEDLGLLPSNLVILKINYDTAKELKAEHAVTIQHTLIQLDNSNNEVTRWIGGGVITILDQLVL